MKRIIIFTVLVCMTNSIILAQTELTTNNILIDEKSKNESEKELMRLKTENTLLKLINDSMRNKIDSLFALIRVDRKNIDELKLTDLLGKRVVRTISKAKQVSTFIVDSRMRGINPANSDTTIQGFKIESKLNIKDPVIISNLKSTLLNPKLYFFDDLTKSCLYFPYLAFRFKKGHKKVDLLICFSCDEFEYYLNNKLVKRMNSDKARTALLELGKMIFTNNEIINNLK